MKEQSTRSLLLGAAFLMATSAIGPGFLTQTTHFTQQLAASFGFVILMSIIIDIGAQLNIWRIIAISEKPAQDIANSLLPGLGVFLSVLIVAGGLAFNIGNIAGAGLGTNVLFGISPEMGALFSGVVAVAVFLVREAGKVMDRFAQIAGFVMIGLTIFVMFSAQPPVGEAVTKTFIPDTIDFLAIITLVGGTVGGYITFAGGHRLLDAGVKGKEALPQVTKSSVSAIGIASIMRIFLFLASLGVVASGFTLNPDNPPASVFQAAAGNVGYKIFGIIMWAAAVTSVVGAAYTSVSFIRTFSKIINKYHKWFIVGFIVISTTVFVSVGEPVKVLIFVGSLNGLILPIALGVMLIAAYKQKIVGDYKHPLWLTIFGVIIVIAMSYMGVMSLIQGIPKLFS
ncbi:Mn2+ and Fe2+ transporters of the NRAMP family [Halobacillus karajensis]|uniref:Manganese transport protein MntH n=1 Tax=Halobacillus karajensis TaxID=195088 RepID=A0A024P584_9BACI|nr:NRAMP family divalent metal transporter [Halobacillus karajensis]CDQ20491.1 manganese transport protein MntH [Halobacillus karajensis]CDQ24040.1 manganese transport protein MntH [Halobacillus karajensis]CDQ27518.1 manganese transport protein MntH [Halobacillus karajensis]SEH90923.1 Mn2+ and Fe2+ transporters of the NRAMP family [Halobacillus karajensis]